MIFLGTFNPIVSLACGQKSVGLIANKAVIQILSQNRKLAFGYIRLVSCSINAYNIVNWSVTYTGSHS